MWYSSGTVSVTNGSGTVTGSGTAFLANVRIGDGIVIEGSTAMHEIIGIASDTSLTIRPAYAGTTGSGRQYATVPVLGYDKDLSDAFNQIRLQFGDTLSALQPWAYAATAAEAMTQLGASSLAGDNEFTGDNEFSGATKLASLLLGNADTEIARAAAGQIDVNGSRVYQRNNIVGEVSQSGGVPTGALVQYGSNPNGEFWRYAGGMQVCAKREFSVSFQNVANLSGMWTFPSGFIEAPAISVGVVGTLGAEKNFSSAGRIFGGSATSATIGVLAPAGFSSSDVDLVSLDAVAVGRWHA